MGENLKIFSSGWWLKYTGISITNNKEIEEFKLPGLTIDETRYFNYLLTKSFCQLKENQWKDLGTLNQKILASKLTR